MKKLITVCLFVVFLTSCQQSCTKNYGGTTTINLPVGRKFVKVTWKGDNLWYVTRSMSSSDTTTTHIFQEDSKYGLLEGKVIFNERKK